MFELLNIHALKDNYIWLLRKGAFAAVVDPGEASPVLEVLTREKLSLIAILVTHHHADHQGGIADLLVQYPAAAVYGPEKESITGLDHPLSGGETIVFPELEGIFQVLAVPGHTLGHIAYFSAEAGVLFCGDMLFTGGCGRIFEGTPAQMFDSLARLAALPERTQIYCGHEYTEANLRFALAVEPGNRRLQKRVDEVSVLRAKGLPTVPSTLALEKATNPFLRCHVPEVIASARVHGAVSDDAIEVFRALREWKNAF